MKRAIKYILYILLFLFIAMLAVVYWPKGSIEKQFDNNIISSLAYVIIDNGEVIEKKTIGDLEQGNPAQVNAIYNVASVTKPVFSLMALKLMDSGLFGLDEPLYKYWIDPDLKNDMRHKLLTPRMLLSHQAGFLNWRWHHDDNKLAFTFDPGSGYNYSGEGMEYLKKAIESKTGKSFEYLADSLIFQPLKMKDSHLVWSDDIDESRFAKWHNKEGGLYETNKRKTACAADDLMTTLDDMSKFVLHIFEKGGMSDSMFDSMVSPQVQVNKRHDFGLGWQLVKDMSNHEYALVHGGSDMGARARIVVMPKSKKAFIAFSNSDNGQKIIDRVMVDKFKPGKEILSRIYLPIFWRIIYLPI